MKRALLIAALALAASAAPASAQISVRCFAPDLTACSGAWHRSDLRIDWTLDPSWARVSGCDDETIAFDTTEIARGCVAQSSVGEEASRSVKVKVDRTPPSARGVARTPDANGWYRSPVQVSFVGADVTSGVAGCSSGTYSGPDAAAADVLGRCWDVAGNVSAATAFGLRYDATPPAIAKLSSAAGDRVIRLKWRVVGATAVEVWRSPGKGGASSSLVDTRAGGSVYDRRLRNGRRYEYRVRAVDAAGNAATKVYSMVPGRRLVAPARRAQLTAPPLLRWTAVDGARYYNVQLFRNGRKILSVWPGRARYQLERSWRYGGKLRRLKPGTYRWMVWPGRGARAASDYGPPLGRRSFTIAP